MLTALAYGSPDIHKTYRDTDWTSPAESLQSPPNL